MLSMSRLSSAPRETPLTASQIEFAQQMLPFRYAEVVNLSSGTKNLLFAAQERGAEYSELHMAAGEGAILRLSREIAQLDGALVLIDEVEAGLHPWVQQLLMLQLQQLALRNGRPTRSDRQDEAPRSRRTSWLDRIRYRPGGRPTGGRPQGERHSASAGRTQGSVAEMARRIDDGRGRDGNLLRRRPRTVATCGPSVPVSAHRLSVRNISPTGVFTGKPAWWVLAVVFPLARRRAGRADRKAPSTDCAPVRTPSLPVLRDLHLDPRASREAISCVKAVAK